MEHRSTFLCLIRPTRPGYVEQPLPEEAAAMQAQATYLEQLVSEKTVLLYGSCPDQGIGLALFEAESLETARRIVAQAPTVEKGMMIPEVHPFRISFLRQPEVS